MPIFGLRENGETRQLYRHSIEGRKVFVSVRILEDLVKCYVFAGVQTGEGPPWETIE